VRACATIRARTTLQPYLPDNLGIADVDLSVRAGSDHHETTRTDEILLVQELTGGEMISPMIASPRAMSRVATVPSSDSSKVGGNPPAGRREPTLSGPRASPAFMFLRARRERRNARLGRSLMEGPNRTVPRDAL